MKGHLHYQLEKSYTNLAAQNAPADLENASAEQKEQFIQSQIEAFNKMRGPGGMTRKDWAFWNTQPVPKFDEVSQIKHSL